MVRAPVGREATAGILSPLVVLLMYLYQSLNLSSSTSYRISVRYYQKLKPVPLCHPDQGRHSGDTASTDTGTQVDILRLCNGRGQKHSGKDTVSILGI